MTKIRCIPERNQQSFYVESTTTICHLLSETEILPCFLADVWLSHPRKMAQKPFDRFGYSRDFPPNMFILTRLSGSREIEILIVK